MKNIGFNIWDDYLEGEDTYGYVEEYEYLSENEKCEICGLVLNAIKSFEGGVIYREFHVLNDGDQLAFQNLFYETKDSLINDLASLNLKHKGIPIDFYSESFIVQYVDVRSTAFEFKGDPHEELNQKNQKTNSQLRKCNV